jgi:hypothetical protein
MSRRRLTKSQRLTLRGAREILAKIGGTAEITKNNPHCKLTCSCGGKVRELPLAHNSREGLERAVLADVRRAVAEMTGRGR